MGLKGQINVSQEKLQRCRKIWLITEYDMADLGGNHTLVLECWVYLKQVIRSELPEKLMR